MLDERRKLWRDWEGLEGAYVRPTGVAGGHKAEGRLGSGADDAQELPEALPATALTPTPHEHVPMRANMLNG